jgi:UDP-N-acetylglucosamine acyltransferase
VRIGTHSMVGGGSRLSKDVPPYFLVEGNPCAPHGLNNVGLRRAEFARDVMAELKDCYRILYRSDHNISQAIEVLQGTVTTDEGRRLLAFLEAPSERGIVK